MLQKRSRTVIERSPNIGLLGLSLHAASKFVTYADSYIKQTCLIKKHSSLSENMTGFHQLPCGLTQSLVAPVHLHESRLMLGKCDIKFVNIMRRTRSNHD